MIGDDERLEEAPSPAARKSGHGRSGPVKSASPKEAAASEETLSTDESESDPGEADRINEILRATVNLLVRQYFRRVEDGARETAESELAESLARARDFFTCVPAPADTTVGPWMPLTANKGQEDEEFYWGRPVYWLDRQVLEELSVLVTGTQAWGQACEDVHPEVLVIDSGHRPYTEDWWRIEAMTPAEAREIAKALTEAADKADLLEAALCDRKD